MSQYIKESDNFAVTVSSIFSKNAMTIVIEYTKTTD